MYWKYFMIIFIFPLVSIRADENSICITEDNPKERIFHSLVDYQTNKLSFNPHESTYEGNYVSFSCKSIELLRKYTFVTYSDENVIAIDLSSKSVKEIEEGAFYNLACLQSLNLHNNSIKYLSEAMFLGIENLVTLNISDNKLIGLPKFVFSNLNNLRTLDLSKNNISEMDEHTFMKIPTLEVLNLSYNKLHKINFYFTDLINLKQLFLDHNYLAIFPIQFINRCLLLETLDLSGNGLVWLDMRPNNQWVFRSLKNLNLSDNYLLSFKVSNLAYHFPNKDLTIDLNNNQFYCNNWIQYMKEFNEAHIKIAPGRNFTQKYYVDGISCDTLNSTDENEDNVGWESFLQQLAQWKNTSSTREPAYETVSRGPEKSRLIQKDEAISRNDVGEETDVPDHNTTIKEGSIGVARVAKVRRNKKKTC